MNSMMRSLPFLGAFLVLIAPFVGPFVVAFAVSDVATHPLAVEGCIAER